MRSLWLEKLSINDFAINSDFQIILLLKDQTNHYHDELKVGVPPGTFDQGCSSGWSPRGARGRGGPQARWKRQRPWREERRSSRSKKRQKPGILGRAQSNAIANPL